MKGIYFFLWILCGITFWYFSKDCNCSAPLEDNNPKKVAPITQAPMIKKLVPIGFECSDAKPKLETEWKSFKDSLLNSLKDNQILEIRGFDLSDETNNTAEESLGFARAKKIRELFSLEDNQVRIASSRRSKNCREEEMYNLLTFRSLLNSAKIKEVGDRTLIYFPFNSTKKLADEEVESYLKDVCKRVLKSGEKIKLTGHTDNIGGDGPKNMALGQQRADIIKDYLQRHGVPAENIMAVSKGASSPIAVNNTEEGRSQNRRTELQILTN